MFETIEGYEQLLTGAHRKPAPVVRPPLLVWHLAFWPNALSENSSNAGGQKTRTIELEKASPVLDNSGAAIAREDRKKHVDLYLRTLWVRLKGKAGLGAGVSQLEALSVPANQIALFQSSIDLEGEILPGATPEQSKRLATDSQVVTFRFFWWGLRTTLRFEFHTEYTTASIYIDLSTYQAEAEFLAKTDGGCEAVADIYRKLKVLDDQISADENADAGTSNRAKYEPIFESLYFKVWEEVHSSVLFTNESELCQLGKVFADFRGLVLSEKVPDEFRVRNENKGENFQRPFWRNLGDRAPGSQRPPESDFWQRRRSQYWAFLTPHIKGVNFADYEFTASRLLQGRALYVTALGPQPPATSDIERFPLCYFFHTHTLNGWQIGRLIDRINHLGTVRLAALIELPELRMAALTLRDVETRIKSAFVQAQQIAAKTGRRPKKEKGPTLEEVENEILDLGGQLREIERRLGKINDKFNGDVEYRIERSRYYVRQFQKGLDVLRIERLEGFQPYDAFVERRLGPAFASIDLLGIRYQRIRTDLASLFQVKLTHETQAIEIATRDQNRDIEKIQAIGEIALFGVLVPYYAGNLIEHALYSYSYGHEGLDVHMPWSWWLATWLIGVLFAILRTKREIYALLIRSRKKLRRASLKTTILWWRTKGKAGAAKAKAKNWLMQNGRRFLPTLAGLIISVWLLCDVLWLRSDGWVWRVANAVYSGFGP